MKCKLIIPASGTGTRFGGRIPKQFIKVNGKELIAYTIEKFHGLKEIDEIAISAEKKYIPALNKIINKYSFSKVTIITEGGKTRQESVHNCLKLLQCSKDELIAIHDAVRPFITRNLTLKMIKAGYRYNCAIPGIKVTDTLKMTDVKNTVVKTIERENLRSVQTPQVFRYGILIDSYHKAEKRKLTGTDESSLVEAAGYKVKITEGEITNIKITIKDDLKKLKEQTDRK
jgi:2-C-methyl-D-erythritol 4-phosphate cytidylyltransferase